MGDACPTPGRVAVLDGEHKQQALGVGGDGDAGVKQGVQPGKVIPTRPAATGIKGLQQRVATAAKAYLTKLQGNPAQATSPNRSGPLA